jgi:hypothetical protein
MDNRKARRALAKARRAAQALTRGNEILECVEENKDLLIEGAEEGVPPVSKIGGILHRKFGEDVKHLPVRQWIGTLTRALLALENYEVDESGVRFTDPVFKSGSTYRRVEEDKDSELAPALEETFGRMVEGLTAREQRVLLKVVETALA